LFGKGVCMRRSLFVLALIFCAIHLPAQSQEQRVAGHYLFCLDRGQRSQGQGLSRGDRCRPGVGILWALGDVRRDPINKLCACITRNTPCPPAECSSPTITMPAALLSLTCAMGCIRGRRLVHGHGRLHASSLLRAASQRARIGYLSTRAPQREWRTNRWTGGDR